MVLSTRCDWWGVLGTASRPSGRLLPRDDPVYGDIRRKARGEEVVTLRLDALYELPYAGADGASEPKPDSKSAVFGAKFEARNDSSVAGERSSNSQRNLSVK